MLAVVPLLCFCLITLALYRYTSSHKYPPSWRRSFLSASVIWGGVLTAITESLSLFSLLTFGWVLALWVLASLAAFSLYLWLGKGKIRPVDRSLFADGKVPRLPLFLMFLLSGVATIIAIVGLIAIIAPPNTWDSMTYHMGRVVHWIQDDSLTFYPTNITRQLHQPPWAEYVILHLQLLSGSDTFANTVQWFGMIVSLVAVSLIAQQLGANLRGQVFAVVIAATLPMGILQASGTQNDYVTACWLLCFVYYLLVFRMRADWFYALGAGASLGLAVLTKGTAYLFAFPILLWFGIWGIRMLRWSVWKPTLLVLLTAFVINLGFYIRNFMAFGNPLGPGAARALYSNDVFSVSTLVSNVLRNLSLQIETPSHSVNDLLQRWVTRLFHFLGLNINDPQTTWNGTVFQINGSHGTWAHEAVAANPFHFLLILLVIILCFVPGSLRKQRLLWEYMAALIGGFLLFSFYLKWQPWGDRLVFALFILFAPLCGVVLAAIPKPRAANVIILLLLLASLPWLMYNQSRPLVGSQNIFTTSRLDQYFINRPYLEAPYLGAAHAIQSTGCTTIGFFAGGVEGLGYPYGLDVWEYPLWVLLNPGTQKSIRIEHVNIQNSSAPLVQKEPFASFNPCAIIAVRFLSSESNTFSSNGKLYTLSWSSGPVDKTFSVDVFTQEKGNVARPLGVHLVSSQGLCGSGVQFCNYRRTSSPSNSWRWQISQGDLTQFFLGLLLLLSLKRRNRRGLAKHFECAWFRCLDGISFYKRGRWCELR